MPLKKYDTIRNVLMTAFLFGAWLMQGQIGNDDCFTPIELATSLGRVCSGAGAYTSFDATFSSAVPDPFCWPDDPTTADVWFLFRASGTAVAITLSGNTNPVPNGSLLLPQFAIYSGVCGGLTELNCSSDGFGEHSIELVQTDLIIGQRYYLRVAGRAGNQGTFQICLNSFNETPDPQSDCSDAVLLCDKSSFNVESLVGTGAQNNEIANLNLCLPNELASSWYKWVCNDPGTLTFILTPNNPVDDIDFILFELPAGLDDCDNKQAIRCMASGANVGAPLSDWVRCSGPTGLREGDPDVIELAGCAEASNNNFLQEVNMVAGRAYVLMINNFSQSGQGFSMEFGGSGTFVGPEAEINIVDGQTFDVIECDKEFTLQESINFPTGTVDRIVWRFGVDATPQQIVGPGPHAVNYSTIGQKTITLSITTDRGCIYNEFVNIDVLPCCDDIMGYDVSLDFTTDLLCNGIPTGEIGVTGVGGQPFYEYSLNGEDWQFNNIVTDLDVGDYLVYMRDRKGCIDSVAALILEPPALIVNAGPDVTIGLGCDVDIEASVTPPGAVVNYIWSSTDTSFLDPGVPAFTTFPPGMTTYTITVIDAAGCTSLDEITVFSDGLRPIFIPNAFSPNNDGINDYFTVFGNKATREISSMQVFDRWGSKVFERRNIRANQVMQGWDGTFNGEILNPGVYAYVIKMLFVDGVEVLYYGDISIIK
jgi:gliding motility-associated-like protein